MFFPHMPRVVIFLVNFFSFPYLSFCCCIQVSTRKFLSFYITWWGGVRERATCLSCPDILDKIPRITFVYIVKGRLGANIATVSKSGEAHTHTSVAQPSEGMTVQDKHIHRLVRTWTRLAGLWCHDYLRQPPAGVLCVFVCVSHQTNATRSRLMSGAGFQAFSHLDMYHSETCKDKVYLLLSRCLPGFHVCECECVCGQTLTQYGKYWDFHFASLRIFFSYFLLFFFVWCASALVSALVFTTHCYGYGLLREQVTPVSPSSAVHCPLSVCW